MKEGTKVASVLQIIAMDNTEGQPVRLETGGRNATNHKGRKMLRRETGQNTRVEKRTTDTPRRIRFGKNRPRSNMLHENDTYRSLHSVERR